MFTLYILYSKSFDRYYVGYTNNIERRITEHNRKKGKFTDAGIPWELVHYELYSTRKEAMKREKFIKARNQNLLSSKSLTVGRVPPKREVLGSIPSQITIKNPG
jgi:putative endonuclease